MPRQSIRFQKIHKDAIIPTRKNPSDAGLDLYCVEGFTIQHMERKIVRTGLKMALPTGFYFRIAPKSGLAVKKGIDILAGVVDCEYRGEVSVAVINFGKEEVEFKKGDAIAQGVVEKIGLLPIDVVEELEDTERGDSGLGKEKST